jgi:DUF4097 and DUF4098 domain-containing protein YvlB
MRVSRLLVILVLLSNGFTPVAAAGASEPGVPIVLATVEQWGIEAVRVETESFSVRYEGGNSLLRGEVFGPPGASVEVTREDARVVIRVTEPPNVRMDASGSVRLHGPSDVEVSVRSRSGAVEILNITNSEVDLASETGALTTTNIEGSLQVDGGSGAVMLRELAGSARVRTAEGDVRLQVSQGTFDVASGRGAIRLFDVSGGFSLESEQGLVSGNVVQVSEDSSIVSGSGRIEFTFTTPMRDLRFELSSEEGVVLLRELKARGSLRFGSGDVLVVARTESGDIRIE